MPYEWSELLNPLIFLGFTMWLLMEAAILLLVVLIIGVPVAWIVCGICALVRDMRDKN